jgi:hypothetical protein
MQVEKSNVTGAWIIYGVVNGYFRERAYYGYTKRDAVRLWRASA